MDAVTRFGKWVRFAPAAAMIAASAHAGGCRHCTSCWSHSEDQSVSAKAVRAADAPKSTGPTVSGWGQGSVGNTPLARPQAPDAPAQPLAPIVPLGVGPTSSTSAPVVSIDPATVPAVPAMTVSTTPGGAGTSVVPVSVSEAGYERASTQVRVVAVIGTDIVITDDEVWQIVRLQAGEYARLTGAERDAKEKEMFRKSLRGVIERELVIADFVGKVKKNKPQLIDEIFDQAAQTAQRQLRDFKKHNKLTTDEEMSRAFRSQGISMKTVQRQWERGAIMSMYLSSIMKDVKANKVGLTEVEQYYKTHADDKELLVEDRAKWQHLFVSYNRFPTPDEARKYADGLVARVKGGEDFAEVAMKYGGEMCKLMKGNGVGEKRGEINPPELEPTVFSLSAGQMSGVIPTHTGLHVVKVVERDQAGMRPFDEKTQAYIRAKLTQNAQEQERLKLIEDLWRKTTVKIVDVP